MKRKNSHHSSLIVDESAPKFTRSFDHVDGNWPSHVYLVGEYHFIGIFTIIGLLF
jgi:hypothetical protein